MILVIFIIVGVLILVIMPKEKYNSCKKEDNENSFQKFSKKNYKEIKRYELLKEEYGLFDKAVDLKRKGKYDEADKIYTNLMNRNGASVMLYIAMAKNLASAQDYNNAITLFKKVISTLGGNEIKTKMDLDNFVRKNRGNLNNEACTQLWNSFNHLENIEAIKNNRLSLEKKLGYLREISGNGNYKL